MNAIYDIREAKTHLSELLKRVQNGEEIVITKSGKPIARLTAIATRPARRTPGMDQGIHPGFDSPLPEFDPDHLRPGDPMRDSTW